MLTQGQLCSKIPSGCLKATSGSMSVRLVIVAVLMTSVLLGRGDRCTDKGHSPSCHGTVITSFVPLYQELM